MGHTHRMHPEPEVIIGDVGDANKTADTGFRRWTFYTRFFSLSAYFLGMIILLWLPFSSYILVLNLLWKTQDDILVPAILLAACLFLQMTLLCSTCSCSRCCPFGRKRGGGAWHTSTKVTVWAVLVLGFALIPLISSILYFSDYSTPSLNGDYDQHANIAVVGFGPSGITAAWLLSKGGRKVIVFETEGELGGHSRSLQEGNLSFDVGYIFNSWGYYNYRNISDHFGIKRKVTNLNVSGAWNGNYWDNVSPYGTWDHDLQSEIDRFKRFVKQSPTMWRVLTPFSLWARMEGFSEKFVKLCVHSTTSVLFVTKMGLAQQSTQAVLNQFADGGWFDFEYRKPLVENTVGGSQNLWSAVVEDMLKTGNVQIKYSSQIVSVVQHDGTWSLTSSHGIHHVGFKSVVLAIPANTASKIVQGRPLKNALVSQVGYIPSSVTLHRDNATLYPAFEQAPDHVLYMVEPAHMTGRIGKIFGALQSDLLLTVHGQRDQSHMRIDSRKVLATWTWSHHYFTIWDLLVAWKVVPWFNGGGGLHYAGDWVFGMGHEDAIRSGIAAACRVGIPGHIQDTHSNFLYSRLLAMCR